MIRTISAEANELVYLGGKAGKILTCHLRTLSLKVVSFVAPVAANNKLEIGR